MSNDVLINIIRYLALLLIQVLILNEIQIYGNINVYLYPLFILMLPFRTPHWLLILLSFLLGFSVDVYANTHGMHAAAATLLGFLRPIIIRFNQPRGDYDDDQYPTLRSMGANWFVIYAAISFLIHHFAYFTIEAFSFVDFHVTLLRIALSTIVSITLAVVYQLILRPAR